MTANKYYVVWVGAAPGVYDSWEEAQVQIAGYPGASYRSFKSQEEATMAFRDGYDKNLLISDVAREIKKMNAEGRTIEWTPPTTSGSNDQTAVSANASAPQTITDEASAFVAQEAANADKKEEIDKKEEAASILRSKSAQLSKHQVMPSAGKTPYIMPCIAVDAACSGNPGPMEYQGVFLPTREVIFKIGPMAGGTNNIGEFLAIVHALALQAQKGTNYPIYSDSVNGQSWVRQRLCKTKLEQDERNAPIFNLIRRAERWLLTHKYNTPIYKWDTKAWGEIPADFGRK